MNKNTKIILLSIISVLIIITIVLGITYSFMRPINETSSITSVNLESCANITLTDTGESINLSNSYPMTKNRALQTTPYTFSVSSSCTDGSGFNLYLATLNTNTLDASNIHYIITEHGNKNVIVEGILSEATNGVSDFESYEIDQINNGINGTYGSIYTIYNGSLSNEEASYDLYLYIDESVTNETMGQTFSAGLAVKASDYDFATVDEVTVTETTNDSITVSVSASGGTNTIQTYYYSINNGEYVSSTSNTYTFERLEMGTEYNIKVYVTDTNGVQSNVYNLSATTDAYVNPVVNSVITTSVDNDSITVSVSATAGTNAIQTYYYSINNGSYQSSSSNTHTFSGLSAGTSYSIRVYVTDTTGVDSNVYTINAETENSVLLADYIKSLYTSQGANGLYYHTSSLANSAADNSYRYAGANPNNYVCFGSDAASCPSANLYRIIGVFGNEVKLIKSTSYGSYAWDSGNSNTWNPDPDKGTYPDIRSTLNTTFLNTLSPEWQDKIATHAYKVGGMSNSTTNTAKQYYNTEVGSSSSSTTDSMKIGLMYVSDFGFGASPDYWTTELYNYEPSKSSNWLAGLSEWTISRSSDLTGFAFRVYSSGYVSGDGYVGNTFAVRPVFYLNSSINYVSGSGSSADPIRIS